MTTNGWFQILFFFGAVLAVTVPLGAFMYRVLEGKPHFLLRPLGWLERLTYRVGGVDGQEQSWQAYTVGMLAFNAFTLLVTYAIQRLQHVLPFNLEPQLAKLLARFRDVLPLAAATLRDARGYLMASAGPDDGQRAIPDAILEPDALLPGAPDSGPAVLRRPPPTLPGFRTAPSGNPRGGARRLSIRQRIRGPPLAPGLLATRLVKSGAPCVLAVRLLLPLDSAAESESFQVIASASIQGTQIRREELAAVFLGERTRWTDGTLVRAVDHSLGSDLRKTFARQVLGRSLLALQNYWLQQVASGRRTPPVVKLTDEEVIAYVAAGPGRIGYVPPGRRLPPTVKTLRLVD